MQCLPAYAFRLLAPQGFGGGALALPLTPPGWTRPGAFPSWSPSPPHVALALHTHSPCECSFHHHRLPTAQVVRESQRDAPWAWPAWDGPASKPGSWDQGFSSPGLSGRGLTSTVFVYLFVLMNF